MTNKTKTALVVFSAIIYSAIIYCSEQQPVIQCEKYYNAVCGVCGHVKSTKLRFNIISNSSLFTGTRPTISTPADSQNNARVPPICSSDLIKAMVSNKFSVGSFSSIKRECETPYFTTIGDTIHVGLLGLDDICYHIKENHMKSTLLSEI